MNTRILTEQEKLKFLNEFKTNLNRLSEIIKDKNFAGYTTYQKNILLEQDPKSGALATAGNNMMSTAATAATTPTDEKPMITTADARQMLGYDPETGEVNPTESVEGYFAALMPNNQATYFPNGSKTTLFDSDDPTKIELFKTWKTDTYSPFTKEWVPTKLSDIVKIGSVSSFVTPEGKKYSAKFQNEKLAQFSGKGWDDFDSWTNINGGRPKDWKFIGYADEQGNGYTSPKPPSEERAWYENFWIWLKDGGWQIFAEVIASVVVGILTAGMSLVAQAAFQLMVGVAFSIDDIARGDYLGAAISIIVSAIPLGFSAAKFGVKDVDSFLKRFGPELKNVKTAEDFAPVWAKMSDPDKLLLTRAFKQTPGELKAATNKMMIPVLQEQVAKNPDYLMKIPFAQRKMWKDIFVEGGVSLGTGLGLSVAAANYQEKKEVEKGIENIKNQDFSQMQADFGKLTPVQQDSTLQADLQRLNQIPDEEYNDYY